MFLNLTLILRWIYTIEKSYTATRLNGHTHPIYLYSCLILFYTTQVVSLSPFGGSCIHHSIYMVIWYLCQNWTTLQLALCTSLQTQIKCVLWEGNPVSGWWKESLLLPSAGSRSRSVLMMINDSADLCVVSLHPATSRHSRRGSNNHNHRRTSCFNQGLTAVDSYRELICLKTLRVN